MYTIVPLPDVRVQEMDEILHHEREAWNTALDWDFSATTDLIARSIAARAFAGYAARDGRRVVAYSYFLPDRERALLGSVHALPEADQRGAAASLLDRCFAHLIHDVRAERIESQFLHFGTEDLESSFAAWGARRWRREFLRAPIRVIRGRLSISTDFALRPFQSANLKDAAALLFDGFAGTPDAEMSKCYRSITGCLSFLEGVLNRTGCGVFEPEASFVSTAAGVPVGMVIASRISPCSGHIVQISVSPHCQRQGMGRALLGAASAGLERRGMRDISLSVTVENRGAHNWYHRLGFRPVKPFAAWVRTRTESRTGS